MAKAKKTRRKAGTSRNPRPRRRARTRAKARRSRRPRKAERGAASQLIRDSWSAAQRAVVSAQQGMEKQLRELLKRNKIGSRDAAVALKDLRVRAEKERRKALSLLDKQLKSLQTRLKKERRALGRVVQDAVQSTLAAFNIPSRREIGELTRKVDALSQKLDTRRRR